MTLSALGAYLGFSEETAFGTPSGTVDNYLKVESGHESLELTRERLFVESLEGVTHDVSNDAKGRMSAAGNLNFPLPYGGGWMMFLSHLCAKAVATTGAGPYTHTLDLSALPDIAARGITVVLGRAGYAPSGTSQAFAYRGCKPTAVEFEISEQGFVRMNVEVFGQTIVYSAHAEPAADNSDFSSQEWIKTPSDATTPTALLTWNGTAYVVKSGTIRIEQPWTRRFNPEDDLMLVPVVTEKRTISAQFEVEAVDTASGSGGALLDDYKQRNARAAVLTVDGATAANEQLQISLASCLITDPPDPHAETGSILTSNLQFEAHKNGATSAGTVVLINSESAAYA